MDEIKYFASNQDNGIDKLIRIFIIAAAALWSFEILKPFLGLLAWGFILAVALYPAYCSLNKKLGDRPSLSAYIMTVSMLLLLVGVLSIMTNNMVISVTEVTKSLREGTINIPPPPKSIDSWPVIGPQFYQFWNSASQNLGEVINNHSKDIIDLGTLLLTKAAGKSLDFIIFIIAMIFSGYLLIHAKELITASQHFAKRLSPKRGAAIIAIIKETIQRVSVGVIGIGLVQAFVFGLILFIAGVPGAGLLTFLALLLSISQIGLLVLIIPVVIWLFMTYSITAAVTYSLFVMLTGLIDNFLKPFVLSRGLTTPMIVIFIGVIGGLLLHGLIGIFIGPVVLSIFYDLLVHWLRTTD
ncbi:MAG TPA: AI-2E family transporter [Gammaproteobacteria bacterium]|jgi:predicted PurR-regulated permease PerM|nr:AI-2E family transporter [Gammaproteobacteria bacterium]